MLLPPLNLGCPLGRFALCLWRSALCMGRSALCLWRSALCMGLVCWSLTSLCHSNGHIETMPAREINPFTALTRIRSQFLKTQWRAIISEWTRLRLRPLSHRGWQPYVWDALPYVCFALLCLGRFASCLGRSVPYVWDELPFVWDALSHVRVACHQSKLISWRLVGDQFEPMQYVKTGMMHRHLHSIYWSIVSVLPTLTYTTEQILALATIVSVPKQIGKSL